MLENTKGAIQRDTDNIRHTKHSMKSKNSTKTQHRQLKI